MIKNCSSGSPSSSSVTTRRSTKRSMESWYSRCSSSSVRSPPPAGRRTGTEQWEGPRHMGRRASGHRAKAAATRCCSMPRRQCPPPQPRPMRTLLALGTRRRFAGAECVLDSCRCRATRAPVCGLGLQHVVSSAVRRPPSPQTAASNHASRAAQQKLAPLSVAGTPSHAQATAVSRQKQFTRLNLPFPTAVPCPPHDRAAPRYGRQSQFAPAFRARDPGLVALACVPGRRRLRLRRRSLAGRGHDLRRQRGR